MKKIICLQEFLVLTYILGGTAGAVVANRLSEDPDVKVLVLERGDIHPGWASRVPLMTMPAAHNPATWVSTATLPMPRILSGADRSVYRTSAGVMDHSVITSATLGGLSRINGTIYTRGLKEEYDNWNIPGWSYEELDGYFKKSEGQIDVTVSAATHGLTGKTSLFCYPLTSFYWCSARSLEDKASEFRYPECYDAVRCPLLHGSLTCTHSLT